MSTFHHLVTEAEDGLWRVYWDDPDKDNPEAKHRFETRNALASYYFTWIMDELIPRLRRKHASIRPLSGGGL